MSAVRFAPNAFSNCRCACLGDLDPTVLAIDRAHDLFRREPFDLRRF
jgi:hypothetical protein